MMGTRKQEKRKGSVMHKSQLQEYAQKAGILPPVYKSVKEGASHEPRFKCIVTLNGVNYESAPGYPNLKAAEHAAAKAAIDALQHNTDNAGVSPSPVHESGLCKNLLQEYAQKNNLPLPVYQSVRSGEDHLPVFTSSVEIAGVKYSGGSAKNKKKAEIKAAKTALLAIQSALTPGVEAETPVATPAKPEVGLSTFIDSQLNNTAGRKRGRGAQAQEENAARKAKTETATETTAAGDAAEETPAKTEDSTAATAINTKGAKSAKKKSQKEAAADGQSAAQEQTVVATKSGGIIADLLATPTAQKILGVM